MESVNYQTTGGAGIHQPKFISQKEQKIIVRAKSVSHILNMTEVTHLICDCYLTTLYSKSGGSVMVAKLLKEFDDELRDYGFIRVNRNAMVNVLHVVSIANGRRRLVTLSNNATIEISRRGMARLKESVEVKSL